MLLIWTTERISQLFVNTGVDMFEADSTYVWWQTGSTTGPSSSGCTSATCWLSPAALRGGRDRTSWSGRTPQTDEHSHKLRCDTYTVGDIKWAMDSSLYLSRAEKHSGQSKFKIIVIQSQGLEQSLQRNNIHIQWHSNFEYVAEMLILVKHFLNRPVRLTAIGSIKQITLLCKDNSALSVSPVRQKTLWVT